MHLAAGGRPDRGSDLARRSTEQRVDQRGLTDRAGTKDNDMEATLRRNGERSPLGRVAPRWIGTGGIAGGTDGRWIGSALNHSAPDGLWSRPEGILARFPPISHHGDRSPSSSPSMVIGLGAIAAQRTRSVVGSSRMIGHPVRVKDCLRHNLRINWNCVAVF
jgi:hypothetical protein